VKQETREKLNAIAALALRAIGSAAIGYLCCVSARQHGTGLAASIAVGIVATLVLFDVILYIEG